MIENLDMMTNQDIVDAYMAISARQQRIRAMVVAGRMGRDEYDRNVEKLDALSGEWTARGNTVPPHPGEDPF